MFRRVIWDGLAKNIIIQLDAFLLYLFAPVALISGLTQQLAQSASKLFMDYPLICQVVELTIVLL